MVLLEKGVYFAVVAQLVEHGLPKPRVAGSSPVYRSFLPYSFYILSNAPGGGVASSFDF